MGLRKSISEQPIDQGLQVESLNTQGITVPTVLPIAMASPPPLPPSADIDSPGMSITGLLSPNQPACNLTQELAAVMNLDSFFDHLENEFLEKTPDKNVGQQHLTTALANQGTTVNNNNMPSSGCA